MTKIHLNKGSRNPSVDGTLEFDIVGDALTIRQLRDGRWRVLGTLGGGTTAPDYGAHGDPGAAINAAIAAISTAGGGRLVIPNTGSDIEISQKIVMRSNVHLQGDMKPRIKLADGVNDTVIEGLDFLTLTGGNTTAALENFSIRGLIIDGNQANNTSPAATAGHGIAVYGRDFVIDDCYIVDTYRTGLWTEYADSGTSPYNGRVSQLTIDSAQEHGWYNEVSDCHFDRVNILSASQKTDNTYDALRTTKALIGTNYSCWRKGTDSNTHRYGLYSEDGSRITNLSIETAKTNAIYLNGDFNNISNARSYNLLGGDHLLITGDFNKVDLTVSQGGLGVTTAYACVIGTGASSNVWACDVDVITSGTLAGLFNLTDSEGGNRFTGRSRDLNNNPINGVPNASDIVTIATDDGTSSENYSYFKIGAQTGTVAAAGSSSQGDATLIEASVTRVFSDNAVRGVRLPAVSPGAMFMLTNAGANSSEVYPATGENFQGSAANAALTLAQDGRILAIGTNNSEWAYFVS